MSQIEVTCQYCGGWGYKRYFDPIAIEFEEFFGGQVKFIGKKDQGTTGNFEFFLDGKKIFSKRETGRWPNDEDRQYMKKEIQAAIDTKN